MSKYHDTITQNQEMKKYGLNQEIRLKTTEILHG